MQLEDYLRERYNLVIRATGSEENDTRGARVSTLLYSSTEDVEKVLEDVRAMP